MGRTKHNRTSRGTHRQRVFQFKQGVIAARQKAVTEMLAAGLEAAPKPSYEVTVVDPDGVANAQ